MSATLVTVAPSLLSPLHLAAYRYCKEEDKKKRRLKKKHKEIERMIKKLPNHNQAINNHDDKQVFFKVYNNIDSLSIKQLKLLREFCTLSYDSLNKEELLERENTSEVEIYNKYRGKIEDQIDRKKAQKKRLFRR